MGPEVFSRSGAVTVPAASSKVTQSGVALTSASLVLATLQQHVAGVSVVAAVPASTQPQRGWRPLTVVSTTGAGNRRFASRLTAFGRLFTRRPARSVAPTCAAARRTRASTGERAPCGATRRYVRAVECGR